MAKDKKAKAAAKKARVAQKTEKKATQKEKKHTKKAKAGVDSSDEDDAADLDAMLASYAAQQEQFLKITETVLEAPPSRRGSSTLLVSPANDNEIMLFGGEYYDGALARFFNDLCVYNINRDEWRLVTSPNSPLPRSGHAWCRGGNAGGIYLFGGEFSSPKQGTFYHYNDFWKLDPASREWTKLEGSAKGRGHTGGSQAPSARSGHRMTYFKNYIVLFGGFQDTSHQTKYLNDLWVYDCQNFAWHSPVLPPASQRPEPRSSFSFLPHESGVALYGGYSRVKVATTIRPTKGGRGIPHDVMKPLVHQDAWFLRITPPPQDAPSNTPPTVRWERRKRPANAPNPPRAGGTMAYHRGRGIQFGGVHDVEQSEEGIDSEFFNTLYVWNIDRNRFFSLGLRRPRVGKKATAPAERNKRGRGKADEEELLKNLASLELQHGAGEMDEDRQTANVDDEQDDDPDNLRVEKPVWWEMPHPRFNAQLTVSHNDVLYIFGGTFEKGDVEYTLDEMYAIDLGKLDGVKEIFKREVEDWQGSEDEDDEEEEDEDGFSDEEEQNDKEEIPAGATASDELGSPARPSTQPLKIAQDQESQSELTEDLEQEDPGTPLTEFSDLASDQLPQPRPFESLRDFYARTSEEWQTYAMEKLPDGSAVSGKSIKEIRKAAFERAEEKWWDSRELVQALEDEQEEAGIGEIVSLSEKAASSSGGANRRR